MKTSKRKYIPIYALILILMLCCLFVILRKTLKSGQQRKDYQQIASTEFDTVFLSMYPIDGYQEEDYSYFRGMTLFKSSCCISSLSMLKDYFRQIDASGNQVATAYLGIRPELTDPGKLRELLEQRPGICYEIMLSYPSASYWQSLSQKDYEKTLSAFCDLLMAASEIPEANFYFFGAEEWLIANPGNYVDQWAVNKDISRTLTALGDRDHGYLVTAENASSMAESLTALTSSLRTAPWEYPDLSDHCIIFFGDSVTGNYTDSASIPGVVSGLTGAETYNCGYGGNSAALAPGMYISLPGIVEAFFEKDLSMLPEDTQVYRGIAAYLENAPSDKQTCFVINYGLNDYFEGFPISSEDPYDISTYSGALRTAVRLIRENAPDAQIILCTPNFTTYFNNGTEPHGAGGFVMTDYVDALLSLAQELGTDVLDYYHDLGITPENGELYLLDQVHPGYAGRFLMGTRLIPAVSY